MDIYCNDKFYDTVMCDICHRNTYYSNGRYYCINCKRICYTRFKRTDNRCRISVKNNCKMQHFKQILNNLLNYNITPSILECFYEYLDKNSITRENINICVVENFVKTISNTTQDNMLKYQLLNIVLYDRAKPSISEINNVIDIFQAFILFIQDLEPNFTMKYDFYVMKIFQYLKIRYNFTKREFKDNTKKNKDNCYWTKFLRYGLKQYNTKKIVCIPEDDQDF